MRHTRLAIALCAFFLTATHAQQVVQRGALGTPGAVMDETQQWTAPFSVAADKQLEIFIPDVSTNAWLQLNYAQYQSRGTYSLTFFTHYRNEEACRRNQILWGLGDAQHLNACIDISYRMHGALIDTAAKSVTLQSAAMVDPDGNILPDSTQQPNTFRTWDQLDPITLTAIKKANDIVAKQMATYDRKIRNTH